MRSLTTLHLNRLRLRAATILTGTALAGTALAVLPAAAQTDWRTRVTAPERAQANPLAAQPAAAAAGQQLFLDNCARCHGADANGKPGRPGLRSDRTAGETDGEFYWILKHGNRWRGMPSWTDLGDDHLWQLVTWLRSQQPIVPGRH